MKKTDKKYLCLALEKTVMTPLSILRLSKCNSCYAFSQENKSSAFYLLAFYEPYLTPLI